jgi:iron complex outermembrane receptor protein
VQGSVVGYYTKFDNRLLAIPEGSAIIGNPTALANVGSVTTKGVELTAAWKIVQHWTLSGSYAYNDSTYDQNVVDGAGTIYPTAGKTVVDAPKHIGNVVLGYDDGGLFGNVDLNYMSRRYYTYENDQSVGGRMLMDLSGGYRFSGPGVLKGVEIQGNITNVLNRRYVATMGTNGYTFTGDYQTLQAGAPREAFITLRKQF